MSRLTSQSIGASLDDLIADAVMVGYGYRRTTELRGEFIIGPDHKVESDTLHTVDVWVRDRSAQPPNPLNHEELEEYEGLEIDACDHGVWPSEPCEDCYDETDGRLGREPGSLCTPFCGFCGRCGR